MSLVLLALVLSTAAALAPDGPGDLARRLRDLRREGQLATALALLDQQPAALTADPRVAGERIQLLLDDERVDEARAVDAAVGPLREGPLSLCVARLRLQVLDGEPAAALKLADEVRAQFKDPTDLLAARLDALCALQRWVDVDAQLEQLPATCPAASRRRLKANVMLARGHQLAADPDQLENAIPLLEGAFALQPERTDVRVELVLALAQWQRMERAERLACEALPAVATRHRADVLFALGKVRQANQRDDEAAECFRDVLALQPRHPGATLGLARCLLRAAREDEALSLVRQRLQHDPDDVEALFLVAEQALERRQAEVAADALGHVLESHPKSLKALYMYSRALALHGAGDQQADVLRRYEERSTSLAKP